MSDKPPKNELAVREEDPHQPQFSARQPQRSFDPRPALALPTLNEPKN